MGLIDLKTDLKSLRYGNDQRGGGSSNQPYITTSIPDGFYPTAPDFLLRGGLLNPAGLLSGATTLTNDAGTLISDVSRLTKWFTDTKSPNGILFTAKQLLLERQNVKIPTRGFNRIYNPLGTIAQVGVLPIGYHLNKQGLDPFARGYFRDGDDGYYKFTLAGQSVDEGVDGGENRLTLLYKLKQTGNYKSTDAISATGVYSISTNPDLLFSYSGGPGSVLGIGNTNIRFTGTGERERTNNKTVVSDTILNPSTQEPQVTPIKKSTVLSSLNSNYNIGIRNFNREDTYGTSATNWDYKLNTSIDSQNYLSSLKTKNVTPENKDSDLIKFFFEVIDPKTAGNTNNDFLFFRAYINSIGDSFKADWQSYKYVGRAENFYKYSGFSRDVSLSFTIYAHTEFEMIPIYEKLNLLLGTTAPRYSGAGLMLGNFVRITIGDYFNNMPSIINNISIKPSFEAGWEINRNAEGSIIKEGNGAIGQIPKLIDVDLSFTPIHTFAPQYEKNFIRTLDAPIDPQADVTSTDDSSEPQPSIDIQDNTSSTIPTPQSLPPTPSPAPPQVPSLPSLQNPLSTEQQRTNQQIYNNMQLFYNEKTGEYVERERNTGRELGRSQDRETARQKARQTLGLN